MPHTQDKINAGFAGIGRVAVEIGRHRHELTDVAGLSLLRQLANLYGVPLDRSQYTAALGSIKARKDEQAILEAQHAEDCAAAETELVKEMDELVEPRTLIRRVS